MSTRRDALRFLAAASAALPAVASGQETKEVQDQPGHLHTGPTVKISTPGKPMVLQPEEFRVVEELAERIIPRSDTPGAKDAGVGLLIDKALVIAPGLQGTFRAGIADLNAQSLAEYGKDFVSLSEEDQIKVLTPMSLDSESPMGKFFLLAKSMTIDAYYKTETGLKTELGWHGNTYLAEFPGCDHPEHMS